MTADRLRDSAFATSLPFFTHGGNLAWVETADDFRVTTSVSDPPIGRVMVEDLRREDDMTFFNTEHRTVEGVAEAVTNSLAIARIARLSSDR